MSMESQERAANKRNRGSNFTPQEKNILLRICNSCTQIIENKRTDGSSNHAKALCWENIARQFNAQSGGLPRDVKALKSKYEAIKREVRKHGTNSCWRVTGGGQAAPLPPPLTEEEKELRNNIILSCEGLAPAEGGNDMEIGGGINLNELEEIKVDATVEVDFTNATVAMLRTPKDPLLKTKIEMKTIGSQPSTPPVCSNPETVAEAAAADANDAMIDMAGASATPIKPPSRRIESSNGGVGGSSSRRRPLINKKESYSSSAAKFELLADEKRKLLSIKESTEKMNNETAAINLEAARKNLRIMELKEETAIHERNIAELKWKLAQINAGVVIEHIMDESESGSNE